jgi:hypothetical protein
MHPFKVDLSVGDVLRWLLGVMVPVVLFRFFFALAAIGATSGRSLLATRRVDFLVHSALLFLIPKGSLNAFCSGTAFGIAGGRVIVRALFHWPSEVTRGSTTYSCSLGSWHSNRRLQ